MGDSLALLFLWWMFGCRTQPSSGPALPPSVPGGQPGWPGSPIDLLNPALPASTSPPWPQVTPTGLPKFPGAGWEFDEPPPPAVQQRAGQLLSQLWASGSGTYRIEQTAGRWIAYQAQVVASGKKGVVAYREKRAALPAPAVTASRSTPRRPAAPPARPAPASSTRAPAPAATPAAATPAAARPAPASPMNLPVLRRGMGIKPQAPNADVRLLQQRLGIGADGQFGAGTENAVRAFQLRKGLKVDGIVGPATWSALYAVPV